MQEEDVVVPSDEQRLKFVEGRMGDAGSILHELVGHRGNMHYRPTTGRVGSLEETAKTHEDRLRVLEAEATKERILRRNVRWPFKEPSNEVRENFDAGRQDLQSESSEEQETRLDWRPGAPPGQVAQSWIHGCPVSRENFDEMRKKQRVAPSGEDSEHREQQIDLTQQPDNDEEQCDTQQPADCEDKLTDL